MCPADPAPTGDTRADALSARPGAPVSPAPDAPPAAPTPAPTTSAASPGTATTAASPGTATTAASPGTATAAPDGRAADGAGPAVGGGLRVEVRARGLLVTDGPFSRRVPVALRYDAGAAPLAVRFVFPGDNAWTFPRALLEAGLRAPVRRGDVEVWPCGRAQAVVEFHSPDGTAVVQFDSSTLLRFLRRTYSVTAPVTG
ncbi:SsgA family sporulation/cell division regulator [Streptomyces sp. NPDC047928]|uniref:SsgA family sporulation/cell division regulator n=1 Tax=unclassified Streptomyces TaxID=2593676 RepID=UPI003713B6B7